jgi:hypothetical protein
MHDQAKISGRVTRAEGDDLHWLGSEWVNPAAADAGKQIPEMAQKTGDGAKKRDGNLIAIPTQAILIHS